MSDLLVNLAYIFASVLFIFGIKMLGSPATARTGNLVSSVGMLLAVVVTMLAELFDDPSLPELREGCRNTYNHMVGPRIPFFMNAMLELGWEDPDPELVEQGLWRLREFRCPNDRVDLDWRINPDFCLSPFPELPWKFDWATEDRFFALHGVPYFEQAIGHFWLRSNPLDNYYDRAGDVSEISAGYLYLYWFLAHRGVL